MGMVVTDPMGQLAGMVRRAGHHGVAGLCATPYAGGREMLAGRVLHALVASLLGMRDDLGNNFLVVYLGLADER